MKYIQITLEDDLVENVNSVSKQLNINRSAFTRKALREALSRYRRNGACPFFKLQTVPSKDR